MSDINPRDGLDGVTNACAGTGWERWQDLGCLARVDDLLGRCRCCQCARVACHIVCAALKVVVYVQR